MTTYSIDAGGKLTSLTTTPSDSTTHFYDVAVGAVEGQDAGQIAVLSGQLSVGLDAAGAPQVSMYAVKGTDTTLASLYVAPLPSSNQPKFISMADVTGDSPATRFVSGPELVPGDLVPIAVLTYPPYSRTYSDGASNVVLGENDSMGTDHTQTVTRSIGLDVGFAWDFKGAKAPSKPGADPEEFKILGINLAGHYGRAWSQSHTQSKSVTFGQTFSASANPNIEGYQSGLVVLSCGCYHAYQYVIEDPANKLGGADGLPSVLLVPIYGQTSVWSSRRYNAMAQALGGGLPQVNIPFKTGSPTTYPDKRQTLEATRSPTTIWCSRTRPRSA